MNRLYVMYIKRLLDILFAIVGIAICSVLFLIIGPFIYYADKGPIIYVSPRLGKNGKAFKMLKFRSMKMNAPDIRNSDGSTYNGEKDPRVTWIGRILRKTSLDEFPQFINVIKGEMSFIGPRPDPLDDLNIYTIEQKEKLNVLPGITGYNQAYFRNSVTQNEKFEHDVFYAKNISLKFDFCIFFKTISTVFYRENIFNKE